MASLSILKPFPSLFSPSGGNQREQLAHELKHYPLINLKNELLSTSEHRFSVGQPFLPVDHESVPMRLTRIYFESGFWESLAEARSGKTRSQSPLISSTADYIGNSLELYKRVKLKVFPHKQELSAERIAQYVETRDWISSSVRCIAWHRHFFKLAVAGVDDAVRIYTKKSENITGAGLLLKNPSQTQITCMAFRPMSSFELVVGCRQGLVFWTIKSHMHRGRIRKPTQIIKHPDNLPITCLEWSKDGSQLITSSIGDRAIICWHPDNGKMQPLKRMGAPNALLKWSPDNEWLFAGTVDRVFRVWKCQARWSVDRWVCNSGNIQAACWSPCGRYLLFVTTDEPILYRLQLVQVELGVLRKDVLAVVDLNACKIEQMLMGGPVQQLAWDPQGKYLVITFKTTSSIAIFRTNIAKYDLQISDGYYLNGEMLSEYPSYVCFQPLYKLNDRYSVLTIGWSSGRIQFYPLD